MSAAADISVQEEFIPGVSADTPEAQPKKIEVAITQELRKDVTARDPAAIKGTSPKANLKQERPNSLLHHSAVKVY